MTTIPYRNSVLTAITAAGSAEDYDQPATNGTARWTGSVGIYFEDLRGTVTVPGRIDEIDQARLELPYSIGRLVQRGDTLTWTFNGAEQTGVAADLQGDPLVGRSRVLLQDR